MLVEGLLAIYFAACFYVAVRLRMWPSLPFLYLFLQGYTYMFLLSVLPARRGGGSSPRLPEAEAESAAGETLADVSV